MLMAGITLSISTRAIRPELTVTRLLRGNGPLCALA
jgi:hypothetical protein